MILTSSSCFIPWVGSRGNSDSLTLYLNFRICLNLCAIWRFLLYLFFIIRTDCDKSSVNRIASFSSFNCSSLQSYKTKQKLSHLWLKFWSSTYVWIPQKNFFYHQKSNQKNKNTHKTNQIKVFVFQIQFIQKRTPTQANIFQKMPSMIFTFTQTILWRGFWSEHLYFLM